MKIKDLVINLQLGVLVWVSKQLYVVDFNSTKQLNYNLQCNYTNFTQPLSCCPNYNR